MENERRIGGSRITNLFLPLQGGGMVGDALHVTINEPLIASVGPILTPALSLKERKSPAAALFYSA